MIKYIELENFQSHKTTRVEFHDGVNAIVGLSDSGKTALLRAINWVVNNKPAGNDFQSYWEGDVRATIGLSGNTEITRGYDKKGHYYTLTTESQGKQEFRAFSREVPAEIRAALNLTDVNIQGQMDTPYLIGDSPGEVAQALNRVVHLDSIDTAISNIRKKKLNTDAALRDEEERRDKLEKELKDFAYLAVLEEQVVLLEKLEVSLEKKNQHRSLLRQLVSRITEIDTRYRQARAVGRYITPITEGLRLCAELEKNDRKSDVLAKLRHDIATKEEIKRQAQKVIRYGVQVHHLLSQCAKQEADKTRRNDLYKLIGTTYSKEQSWVVARQVTCAGNAVEAALELLSQAKEKSRRGFSLDRLCSNIRQKQEDQKTWAATSKQVQREFDEAFPARCPLCGAEQ